MHSQGLQRSWDSQNSDCGQQCLAILGSAQLQAPLVSCKQPCSVSSQQQTASHVQHLLARRVLLFHLQTRITHRAIVITLLPAAPS